MILCNKIYLPVGLLAVVNVELVLVELTLNE